jgi:hypothetical protein
MALAVDQPWSPSRPAVGCGIDLYWLPLGAGGRSVRLNGRVYEAVAAGLARRHARDLYHSALIVHLPEGDYAIEMGPVARGDREERGVVAEGPVGSRWLRSFRVFRYEVRCRRNGIIPDVDEAVASPQRLTSDAATARRVLELVRTVGTPVWGRDECRTGDMWNSNSLTSWLIVRCGLDAERIAPPAGGRAPGWQAGVAVANRERRSACTTPRC